MAVYPRSPFPVPPLLPSRPPSNLHEALNCLVPANVIEEFIRKHPDSIHESGFNGQSALHKAIMTAEVDVIDVLLRYGSDPNARNQFEETPFLFASRRGNPQILHLLLKYGADPKALDKAGKGAVLFAAHGGSVINLEYLRSEVGLSLFVCDDKGQTPLHIICQHGHVDALMYLLRKERCDIFQKDELGQTCLHACIQVCNFFMIWTLMERGGVRLLNELNNDGYTPLDLAKKGEKTRNTMAAKILDTYTRLNAGKKDGDIRGPVYVWWWHLVAPAVIYAASLLLAQLVTYEGVVVLLGVIAIMAVVMQQGHRMKHVSRWPNPMYAGMFGAGFLHTVVCFYAHVFPVIYSNNIWLGPYSILHFLLMSYMYYQLLTLNPGQLKQPRAKDDGTFYTLKDVASQQLPLQSYCTACEIVTVPKTKHCRLCQVCYTDMDHHCLFLYRCIARWNHRLFIRFILVVMLAMVTFEYSCVLYLHSRFEGSQVNADLYWTIFTVEPWIWSSMLFNAFSLIWGACLLRTQLNVVARGHTSYYQLYSAGRRITGIQLYVNMVKYILGKKLTVVESKEGLIHQDK